MRKIQDLTKKVVQHRYSGIPAYNHVLVSEGTAFLSDASDLLLSFPSELEDGMYNKQLFDWQIYATSNLVKMEDFDQKIFGTQKLKRSFDLPFEQIKIMHDATMYCGTDDLRPVMMGVYIDSVEICATDAHKLYRKKVETEKCPPCIIPISVIKILYLGGIDVIIYSNHDGSLMKALSGEYMLTFKPIQGKYPNFNAVIPQKAKYNVNINRIELMNCLKIMKWFSNSSTHAISFCFKKGKVLVSGTNKQLGITRTEELKCNWKKSDFMVSINHRFLVSILKPLKTDEILFQMNESSTAIMINEESLVMPIRFDEDGN